MTEGFTGTGVALATPFKEDKTIDFDALERLINHVLEGGLDYLVVMGTTGESVTLSKDEKKAVIEAVIRYNKQRVPIVLGIGGNNTSAVIEEINEMDFTGISGLLSVAPYYNKPTQEGLYQHFTEIALISPVPVILYNVPSRTGSNINATTVLKLAAAHSNIVAVKEASGNLPQIMQILKGKPDHFVVLSGDDALTLPMIHLGAAGVISVIANSHPAEYSNMVRAALKEDKILANAMHFKMLDLIDALFEEGNPAGVKMVLKLLNICEEHVRLPLVPATDKLRDKLKKLI